MIVWKTWFTHDRFNNRTAYKMLALFGIIPIYMKIERQYSRIK